MYILLGGSGVTFVLGWYLIPIYGINGDTLATTLASLIITKNYYIILYSKFCLGSFHKLYDLGIVFSLKINKGYLFDIFYNKI